MQIVVVNPGESLWQIANRYGVAMDAIIQVNALDEPNRLVTGQALVIPTEGGTHTVTRGESLWSIANRYGVNVQTLAQLNGITNPALIYPGLVLRIPERTKTTIETNGYLQPSTPETDRGIIQDTEAYLTYFSIFSYRVTAEGNLIAPNDEAQLSAIRETASVPMMVITNFGEEGFSSEIGHAIFTNEAARRNLMDQVVQTMGDKQFYALNIDFEHLFPADRELYNQFLREITARVHQEGHLVSTALAPKISAAQTGAWYEAHDYRAHGEIVDFVILMTYEWGWSGGPPMAVSPIPQVRRVLEYALSVIPNEKIMMGAPLYGYDWTLPYVQGGEFARSRSPQAFVRLARDVGANIQYDYTAMAPFFKYYDSDGKQHEVWFEDARSMQAKFDLIKQYGLRGISYWLLGNAFPQNWALLADNFNIRKL